MVCPPDCRPIKCCDYFAHQGEPYPDFDSSFESEPEDVIERRELEKLRLENEKLKAELAQLKKPEVSVPVLTAIQGGWEMVSSTNTEKMMSFVEGKTFIEEKVFLHGQQFYVIYGTQLFTYYKLDSHGGKILLPHSMNLATSEHVFVEENTLVTVYMQMNGEEYGRIEKFVKNGKLHVVVKRFGITCTRVFKRIEKGPEAKVQAPRQTVPSTQLISALHLTVDKLAEKVKTLGSLLEDDAPIDPIDHRTLSIQNIGSKMRQDLLKRKQVLQSFTGEWKNLETLETVKISVKDDLITEFHAEKDKMCVFSQYKVDSEEERNGKSFKAYLEGGWIRTTLSGSQDCLSTGRCIKDGKLVIEKIDYLTDKKVEKVYHKI